MSITFSIPIAFAGTTGQAKLADLDTDFQALVTALSGLVAAMADLPLTRAYTGTQRWAQGVGLTAAATLNLGSDGNAFIVGGNTGITAISTLEAGTIIFLKFTGTPTLTHSANLQLQGAVNATIANGDIYVFKSLGGGAWEEVTRRLVTNADSTHFLAGDGVYRTPSSTTPFTTASQPVRALDTIYHNLTGGTIAVKVVVKADSPSNVYSAQALIGAASPPTTDLGTIQSNDVAAATAVAHGDHTFFVPNNYFYEIVTSGGHTLLDKWTEWQ